MKQNSLLLFVMVVTLFTSCSGGSEKKTDKEDQVLEEAQPDKKPQETVIKPAGLALIESSDCLACHAEREKLVGPSYVEMAAKYADNFSNEKSRLVKTIIEGGYGIWGEVPMTPHPQHTKEDAEKMLTYIMSLNK